MNSLRAVRTVVLLALLVGPGQAQVTINVATSPASPVNWGQPLTLYAYVFGDNNCGEDTIEFNLDSQPILGFVPATQISWLPAPPECLAILPMNWSTAGITVTGHRLFAVDSVGVAVRSYIDLTINQAVPPVSLTSSLNPSTVGQVVTLTATVPPQFPGARNPTGTVTFSIDGTPQGTQSLTGEVAQWVASGMAVGNHAVQAAYSGDTYYQAETATLTQTVKPLPATTTTLVTAPNPSNAGQPVTLTATVSLGVPSNLVPAGTVTFWDGGAQISTVTLSNGTGAATTSGLTAGTHNLTAVYSGNQDLHGSTSNVVNQVVNKAPTTISLVTSPNPSTVTPGVTLTAAVSPANGPTGTIFFYSDGTQILSVALSGGAISATTAALTAGTHALTAAYSGDSSYAGSTSAAVNQVVHQAVTTTTLTTAPDPSTMGQPVALTALVSSGPAQAILPTGIVVFSDTSGTAIPSVALSNGTATATISTLAPGSHTLKASYGGDANYQGSSSGVYTHVVNRQPTTTSMQASPASCKPGQNVMLTASVSPSTATGVVTFQDGPTTLGTAGLAAGTATLPISSMAPGSHSLTAFYGGDTNYAPSVSSPPVTESVGQQTTTTVLAATPDPAVAAQPVTLTATVTPGTATGSVSFLDGVNVLGTAPVGGGIAAYTIASLSAGNHSLTAAYNGDTNDAPSTSAAVSESVSGIPAGPNPVSVSPASGSESSQVMIFTFSDSGGWQDLSVVNVLINNVLDGRNACYLAYSRTAGVLYLVEDDGGTLSTGLVLGGSGNVANSQCSIAGQASTASGNGDLLTVTLVLTFSPSFGGNKIVYMAAGDLLGNNSGWQALGVWQVPFTPSGTIAAVSLTPARQVAQAGSAQTFTSELTDSRGSGDFGVVNMLVNNSIDGRNACYLAYSSSANVLMLVDDAGDAGGPYAGSLVLNGSAATIQNSQCAVNGAGSSAAKSGNTLTLILNITCKPPLAGNRIVWLAGRDAAGANNTGWQAMGTTTVQ